MSAATVAKLIFEFELAGLRASVDRGRRSRRGLTLATLVVGAGLICGCSISPAPRVQAFRVSSGALPSGGLTAADIKAGNQVRSAVSVLSIGTGLCVVVSCPNGAKMISDCGSLNGPTNPVEGPNIAAAKDFFNQVVGNDDLYITVSHPDRDHYNQIQDFVGDNRLVQAVLLGGDPNLYDPDFMAWVKERQKNQQETTTLVTFNPNDHDNQGTPNPNVPCGAVTGDGVYVLTVNSGRTTNDNSIILKLVHGTYSATFMGDAGDTPTIAVMKNYPGSLFLNTTLLVSAHHGATTGGANSPPWARATLPNAVAFSAGTGYPNYGHPRCTTEAVFVSMFGERVADAPAHPFTCYVKVNDAQQHILSLAQYNTRDVGAVVVLSEAGSWGLWSCPVNAIGACVPSVPQQLAALTPALAIQEAP